MSSSGITRWSHIRRRKSKGNIKGNPMARDPQAALVALNRFGFGARGGAAGDFVNAASDPRGFVKAELNRPNGGLLEVPGLSSTPALASAVFAYQLEVQQSRAAAAKSDAPASEAVPPSPDTKAQRRNLSLDSIAMDMSGKDGAMQGKENGSANAAMAPTEPMPPNAAQPNTPKPPPQPLNIIQRTYRAEALARLQRAIIADCGFVERLVAFWSNHFCISANKGELARIWACSAASSSTPMRTSRARSGCSARSTRTTASRRAKRRWPISPAIPPPRNSSRPNSRAILWPTIRRRRWWRGCRTCSANPTATLEP